MNLYTKLLLYISAALFIIACSTEQKTQQLEEEKEPDSTSAIEIESQGLQINHKVFGEGEYTLLFVHGWCINQGYWSNQVEALSNQYKIVTIDLPGFGESGKNREEWTIENYGEDINAVIDQLQLKNVILIGHSMGGDVILEAAIKNKSVIALIGVDNFKEVGVEYTEEMIAEVEGFLDAMKNSFDEVSTAYVSQGLFPSDADSLVKNRVIQDFQDSDSLVAMAALENLFQYTPKEFEQLKALQQKLYLINSDTTPTNKDGLDSTGVKYEVVDIQGTGHYPMIEKPEVFTSLLTETLAKIVNE